MQKIKIKPLSVNECWQGKRFKTNKYKDYERLVLVLLDKMDIPEPPLALYIERGLSSPLADIDNPCKPFVDILQKKYGFNDKDINVLNMRKKLVKKGEEYIFFTIDHTT